MSDAWRRFSDSVTGAISSAPALERYDLGALAALDAAGRARAEALLLSRLDVEDPRIVAALDLLATPPARDALAQLVSAPVASQTRLVAAEHARDAEAVADVLERTTRDDLRAHAAAIAATLPRAAALDAALLGAARATTDATTRHALVDAWLTRAGRPPPRLPPDGAFWVLPLAASASAPVRAWGLDRLDRLGPACSRPDPRYDRFRAWLAEPTARLDEETATFGADPVERAWAIDALAWRLGKGDPRAPGALLQLRAVEVIPLLAAVAPEAAGDLAPELAIAIAALQGP